MTKTWKRNQEEIDAYIRKLNIDFNLEWRQFLRTTEDVDTLLGRTRTGQATTKPAGQVRLAASKAERFGRVESSN